VLRERLGATETGGIRLDEGSDTVHAIGLARDRDLTRSELGQLEMLRRPLVALSRHAAWLAARGELDRAPYAVPPAAAAAGITHRELQVLELLADGLLAVTIGHRLALSPRTIHHHLGHIYTKLGTHDRLSTVIRAQQAGLLAQRPS
jgi:DNA-binding NarL/FixJ family response regulator